MQVEHVAAAVAAVFGDPNLVSTAGPDPMFRFAQHAGLVEQVEARPRVPSALVARMLVGADPIDDMNLLIHCGRGACSTGRTRQRHWDRCLGTAGSDASVKYRVL